MTAAPRRDDLKTAVERRRNDPVFQLVLQANMKEHHELLEMLKDA